MKKHTITVLVNNKSGVLTRVSGMFARRCFNINSLIVCCTGDTNYSRMTIVVTADKPTLEQVIKQLDKMLDVVKICSVEPSDAVICETLMVKIKKYDKYTEVINKLCSDYNAVIADKSEGATVIILTHEKTKISEFLSKLKPSGIIEYTRTGLIALGRGKQSINDLVDYNDTI